MTFVILVMTVTLLKSLENLDCGLPALGIFEHATHSFGWSIAPKLFDHLFFLQTRSLSSIFPRVARIKRLFKVASTNKTAAGVSNLHLNDIYSNVLQIPACSWYILCEHMQWRLQDGSAVHSTWKHWIPLGTSCTMRSYEELLLFQNHLRFEVEMPASPSP